MPGTAFKRTVLTTLRRRIRKLMRRRAFTILLNNLQRARADAVEIKELIFLERFGENPSIWNAVSTATKNSNRTARLHWPNGNNLRPEFPSFRRFKTAPIYSDTAPLRH